MMVTGKAYLYLSGDNTGANHPFGRLQGVEFNDVYAGDSFIYGFAFENESRDIIFDYNTKRLSARRSKTAEPFTLTYDGRPNYETTAYWNLVMANTYNFRINCNNGTNGRWGTLIIYYNNASAAFSATLNGELSGSPIIMKNSPTAYTDIQKVVGSKTVIRYLYDGTNAFIEYLWI